MSAPDLQFELARTVVQHAAAAMATVGVVPMPVKGAYLGAYRGRVRPMRDVDLLVGGHEFVAAAGALERAGFVRRAADRDGRSVSLASPDGLPPIDLHRGLGLTGVFRRFEAAHLARATVDRGAFGEAVRLPLPPDAALQVVVHHATSRPVPPAARTAGDLACFEEDVTPARFAKVIREAGAERAAAFVLRLLGAEAPTWLRHAVERTGGDDAPTALALRCLRAGPFGERLSVHLVAADAVHACGSAAWRIRGTMARGLSRVPSPWRAPR